MKSIKYLVMDVDGTLTDGKIYMGNDGEVMKAFNIKDGCGIREIAICAGIEPIIITARESRILERRCHELGIKSVYQRVPNKIEKLKEIIKEYNQVAYIGDDINDLASMHFIKDAGGVIGCPKDAVKNVIKIADFVSEFNGGDGAVRDFIEWLVDEKK